MTEQDRLSTPDVILHAALRKEEQARDFYAELEATCSVDFVKDLLLTLQNEESKHMHMIQRMLRRLDAGKDIV